MQHSFRTTLALVLACAAPLAAIAVVADAPVASAVSCTVTVKLSPNQSDGAVVCLEQRLIELGYGGIGTPDTTYGANSITAVKAFQTSRGLYNDGIVTSVTGEQLGLRGALPGANAARVTILGDSTSAAMRWYDEANNVTTRYDIMGSSYDLLWSIESCRRLVNASCTGRTDPGTGLKWKPISVLPMMQTTLYGQLGEALVIMAGYDDTSITNAIDPIMAEAKQQGVARVFWLNYRVSSAYGYGPYYAAHNANLEAAKVRHPNLTVLDWNGYTYSQSSAIQTAWFESDQIHMKAAGATALANWLKSKVDSWKLDRCKAVNALTGAVAPPTGEATATSTPTGFTGVSPLRIIDTRDIDNGGINGRVGAGRVVELDINAEVGVDTQAVALSVTAVDPCTSGYLTVYDCDVRPNTSNINFVAGRTTAGMAITTLNDRRICVFSSAAADLIVDITGEFDATGDTFFSMAPTRWIDTRDNSGVQSVTIGARASGSDTELTLAGVGDIPADASAVWLNITGVGATGNVFLTAYPGPCGTAPLASNVNIFRGRTAASAALVGIGTGGSVCIRVGGGNAHLVIDVSGWFQPTTSGMFYIAGPLSRPYDSRPGAAPAAGFVHEVPLSSVAVLNVTSANAPASGFVAAKPCGVTATSSLLNGFANEPTANATAVAPGVGGEVCVTGSMATHIIVDQLGTFVELPA
ncbi:MAG: peptidoglycan-binding protein [Ilumatobacteraceae bacterium]